MVTLEGNDGGTFHPDVQAHMMMTRRYTMEFDLMNVSDISLCNL